MQNRGKNQDAAAERLQLISPQTDNNGPKRLPYAYELFQPKPREEGKTTVYLGELNRGDGRDTWYYFEEYLKKERATPAVRKEWVEKLILNTSTFPDLNQKPRPESAPLLFIVNQVNSQREIAIPSVPRLMEELLKRYPQDYDEAELRTLIVLAKSKGRSITAKIITAAADGLKHQSVTRLVESESEENTCWTNFSIFGKSKTAPSTSHANSENQCKIM